MKKKLEENKNEVCSLESFFAENGSKRAKIGRTIFITLASNDHFFITVK